MFCTFPSDIRQAAVDKPSSLALEFQNRLEDASAPEAVTSMPCHLPHKPVKISTPKFGAYWYHYVWNVKRKELPRFIRAQR